MVLSWVVFRGVQGPLGLAMADGAVFRILLCCCLKGDQACLIEVAAACPGA